MRSPEDDKWLDEALSEIIGSEETRADFEQWKQNHPQAVEMLTSRACGEAHASPRLRKIGRIIMKSSITRAAAAAAIAIACLAGLFLLKSTGSGIALAEVLERIEQVTAYRCQMSAKIKSQGMDEKPISQATMLTSEAFGAKTIIEISNPITGQSILQEIYVLLSQKTITTLMPNEKKYSQLEFDEASFDGWREENDSRTMIRRILGCEHTNLGRSTIDGIEVEGFQTTDPNGPMGQAEIKIWVDVETRLPVQIEIHKDAGDDAYIHFVVHDYQWGVTVDATDFEPVIPDDYTPGQPMMQMLRGKKPNSQ
ncbi:MAG: hypothetical protein AMJ65_08535 [Phycisphaerae bacterium SG8_4]|nr:MAG: hypothetical protein AMJ65_08535 [Phycisphaerae bacterium SG8_4]